MFFNLTIYYAIFDRSSSISDSHICPVLAFDFLESEVCFGTMLIASLCSLEEISWHCWLPCSLQEEGNRECRVVG